MKVKTERVVKHMCGARKQTQPSNPDTPPPHPGCNDSDGWRPIKDISGKWIDLARCKLAECGEEKYCDMRRQMGMCTKGLR